MSSVQHPHGTTAQSPDFLIDPQTSLPRIVPTSLATAHDSTPGNHDPSPDHLGPFATTIFHDKNYSHVKTSGHRETWSEASHRVAHSVITDRLNDALSQHARADLRARVEKRIRQRQFMPGGRYLYAAGRKFQQFNSCFLFKAFDSREGWGDLFQKVSNSLMTGGGIGVDYQEIRPEGYLIAGLGGTCSGPVSVALIVNEMGRYMRQGGSRRSAIWARLPWWHPDVFNFIHSKMYSKDLKDIKERDFNFPAPLDCTNISVGLDSDFFRAYDDPTFTKTYSLWGSTFVRDHDWARRVYWECVRRMREDGEPGFSIDTGDKENHTLRNAPVHGDTQVLTNAGYVPVRSVVGVPVTVWTGKQWVSNVVFKRTADMVPTVRVRMTGGREIVCDPSHPFLVETWDGRGDRRRMVGVERVPACQLEEGDILQVSLPQPYTGRVDNRAYTLGFVYGDGSFDRTGKADLTVCDPKKEVSLQRLLSVPHVRGRDARGYQRFYFNRDDLFMHRSKAEVPSSPSDEWTASFLAGLFDADGNAEITQKRIRLASVEYKFLCGVARMLETLGVLSNVSKGGPSGFGGRSSWQLVVASDSMKRFVDVVPTLRVRMDLSGYESYRKSVVRVVSVTPNEDADVYCCDVGVEEHSFCAEGVIISNCTEVDSSDDGDQCNLASLNMSRFRSIHDFSEAVRECVAFNVCGSLESKLPMQYMYGVREKNRRLGLGLMGIHEWLLQRGYRYGPCKELDAWLAVYASSGVHANAYCDRLGISRPVATRAIAPNGTISIVAETTSGIEPIFAAAYKRRYLKGKDWHAQYKVDESARRMIARGVDPALIEDALSLAEDVERRIAFQAHCQEFVDHAISSTINLPPWGSSLNNEGNLKSFGDTLMKYLPRLRGITTYPDGSRGGQPLTRVPYHEAIAQEGVEFVDNGEEGCKSGVCGT